MANKNKKRSNKQKKGNGNGKKGGSKPKSQFTQPKVLSRTGVPRSLVRGSHHVQTCSIVDPFCIHARGAQRPDGLGSPTIAVQLKSLITMLANSTNGVARTTFIPSPFYSYNGPSYLTGVWTAASNHSASTFGNSLVSTYAQEIRIVSFGIIFRSTMTASTAKGNIIVTVDLNPILSGTVNAGVIQGESCVMNLAAGTEFAWISKPMGPTAHLFRPASTFSATQVDFGWTSVTVEVVGGDTTSAIPYLTAELFMNIEFTMAQTGTGTTGLAQLSRTPPPSNPIATLAQNRVQTTANSIIEGGMTIASNYLSKMAMKALTDIGEAVMTEGPLLLTL